MTDKIALITGGNRGLGFATAKALAGQGWQVVITARTAERAENAAALIRHAVPGNRVEGRGLELTSWHGVRDFARDFSETYPALHLLIANAVYWGAVDNQPHRTSEGWETTFATNHLGHFLLGTLLQPLLKTGAHEAGEARAVVVSSRMHLPGTPGPETHFDFEDLDTRKAYHPMLAYKNSKLANIWFTYEWQRRLAGTGVTVNAVCPGFVPETEAERSKGIRRWFFRYIMPLFPFATRLKTGVATYLYAATEPSLKGVGGKFYTRTKEIRSHPASYDEAKAARLWELSAAAVNISS